MKIAIVGTVKSTKLKAPYDDPDWIIWGLNMSYRWMPRYDVLFEIHRPDLLSRRYPKHWQWLTSQDQGKPIYMQQAHPDIKHSVQFPLQEIVDRYKSKYFCTTVSYMIALAMHQGATEIGIWGCDMSNSTERQEQRPSVCYWIGKAEGQGIKVTIPKRSPLCKTLALYGYDLKI